MTPTPIPSQPLPPMKVLRDHIDAASRMSAREISLIEAAAREAMREAETRSEIAAFLK